MSNSVGLSARLARNVEKLDAALDRLAAAKPLVKATYQTPLFQVADTLFGSDEGLEQLYARAPRFESAGVFSGGGWADPARLQPPLVRGSLDAGGVYPVVEGLSELRMLALATGAAESERASAEEARDFLEEVLALNLDLLFPRETEAERLVLAPWRPRAQRLVGFVGRVLGLENLGRVLVEEVEAVCAQRPIMTGPVRKILGMLGRLPESAQADSTALQAYVAAVDGPSELSQANASLADYRACLNRLDTSALEMEAAAFGASLRATGLGSRHHAVLLRRLRAKAPQLLGTALALNGVGQAELEQNLEFAQQLLKVAILPACSQAIYGFALALERGLLSRSEVAGGLRRLVDLDLSQTTRTRLLAQSSPHEGVTANSILVAGALSVLGQPLGIGQGRNPTCQAARGISLWSQHAPGFLLELVASAARDDLVQLRFEEDVLRSDQLTGGLAPQIDPELDPVSLILTPHLDRLYDEIMRRVAGRSEDGHKWANPGLYGRWVPHGFASLLDKQTGVVTNYEGFVRRFYATHHPAFNDGYELIYPNPVGLFVTNAHGSLLGLHAVALQRIQEDGNGVLRAYFFNPNNEGRQDWGQGIRPSISGRGEQEGESSLPFAEFASRLYAFHYNPYEEGDAFAVPRPTVEAITQLARRSWGEAYPWDRPAP